MNVKKKRPRQKWTKPVNGISFPYYDEEGKRYIHSYSAEELRESGVPESLIKKVTDYQDKFIQQVSHKKTKKEEKKQEDDIVNFLNS